MSNGIEQTPFLPTRPLMRLVEIFMSAHDTTGDILLPRETYNQIIKSGVKGAKHPTSEVEAIVQALDTTPLSLCHRLTHLNYIILCSIFLHSETCSAQHRGLYLLTEALHECGSEEEQLLKLKRGKKRTIGQAALTAMIKRFLSSNDDDHTRRWMGLLALELLRNNPENVIKLQSVEDQRWRSIKDVLEYSSCQVLKLIAGDMMSEMWKQNVPAEDLWPSEDGQDFFALVPKHRGQDTQWIISFEQFVDGLVLQQNPTLGRSNVIFAHAVAYGNKQHTTDIESAILVTVSNGLTIVVPRSSAAPARYIDAPLQCVQETKLGKRSSDNSQVTQYGLFIHLSNLGGATYYVNAVAHTDAIIFLAFVSKQDASALMKMIHPQKADTRLRRKICQSEPIDLSVHNTRAWSQLDRDRTSQHESDDDLGNPLQDTAKKDVVIQLGSHDLLATTPDPLVNIGRQMTQQDPSRLLLSSTPEPRKPPSLNETGVRTQWNGTVAVSQGIDISIACGSQNANDVFALEHQVLSPEDTSDSGLRGAQEMGNIIKRSARSTDRISDMESTGSIRYQTGTNGIENAIAFEDHQDGRSEEIFERPQLPNNKDKSYDSIYDKDLKMPTRESRASPSDAPSSSKSKKAALRDRYGRFISSTSRPPQDESMQNLSNEPPVQPMNEKLKVPTQSVQSPTRERRSRRLSRQLQNSDGNIKSIAGLSLPEHLESPEARSIEKLSKKNSLKNGKADPSTKQLSPVQRQGGYANRIVTNRKQGYGKDKIGSKSTNEQTNEITLDLLNSPRSPPNINRDSSKNPIKKVLSRPSQAVQKDTTARVSSSAYKRLESRGVLAPMHAQSRNTNPAKKGHKVTNQEDESIWDVEAWSSNDEDRSAHSKKQKASKVSGRGIPKVEIAKRGKSQPKKSKVPVPARPVSKDQPPAASLVHRGPRRAAALKANKKIQRLSLSDDMSDGDDSLDKPRPKPEPKAANSNEPPRRAQKSPEVIGPETALQTVEPVTSNENVGDSVERSVSEIMPASRAANGQATSTIAADEAIPDLDSAPDTPKDINLANDHSLRPVTRSIQNPTSKARQNVTIGSESKLLFTDVTNDIGTQHVPADHQTNILHNAMNGKGTFISENPVYVQDVMSTPKSNDKPNSSTEGPYLGTLNDEDSHFQNAWPETEVTPSNSPIDGAEPRMKDTLTLTRAEAVTSLSTATRKAQQVAATKTKKGTVDTRSQGAISTNKLTPNDPFSEKLRQCTSTAPSPKSTVKHTIEQSDKEPPGAPIASKGKSFEFPIRQVPQVTSLLGKSQAESPNQARSEELEQEAFAQRQIKLQTSNYTANALMPLAEADWAQVGPSYSSSPSKRMAEANDRVGQKRKRLVSVNPDNDKIRENPLQPISRKAPMISFSASGPRNQGTATKKKRKHADEIGNASPPEAIEWRETSGKSGSVSLNDGSTSLQNEQHAKRRKRLVEMSDTKGTNPPRGIPRWEILTSPEETHKPSSQSTRVNENGSPMPHVHDRNDALAAQVVIPRNKDVEGAFLKANLVDDGGQALLEIEDDMRSEPQLPANGDDSMVQASNIQFQTISTSKQQPSSPQAPSSFASMQAHHVFHDGGLVNAKTKEKIVPAEPHDPFVGASQNPPGSFLSLLHKFRDREAKRRDSKTRDRKTSPAISKVPLVEDPDVTLVEPEITAKKPRVRVLSSMSSGSGSTSTKTQSQPEDLSGEDSDEEVLVRWRKALEPHQGNMMDTLAYISHHLVRHLVTKEEAVKDIVNDYALIGHRVIEGYAQERQKVVDANTAELGELRGNLERMYRKALDDLDKIGEGMGGEDVRDVEERWVAEQEKIDEVMNRALAVCGEIR